MKKISKDTQSSLLAILCIIGFIFNAAGFIYGLTTVIATVGLTKFLYPCTYFVAMCLAVKILDKLAKE